MTDDGFAVVDALAEIAQALGLGCELACDEVVQGVAREPCIQEWIPAPVLERREFPALVFELVGEQQRIDLVRAREPRTVDAAQFFEQLFAPGHAARAAGVAQVVELGVVAMVAELCGVHRRIRAELVDVPLAERLEARVFARRRREGTDHQ